jgi:hypothetical protein
LPTRSDFGEDFIRLHRASSRISATGGRFEAERKEYDGTAEAAIMGVDKWEKKSIASRRSFPDAQHDSKGAFVVAFPSPEG